MSSIKQYDKLNEKRQKEVNDIILNRTLYAAGTGFIPIPIVDAAALLAVQMYMLRDITAIYGLEFKEQRVKSLISVLVGDIATISLFKFFPGLGYFFGGTSAAIIGASTTYALGKVFSNHFEKGGTFVNFDAVQVENEFKEKVEEGKKVVKNLRKSSKSKQTFSATGEHDHKGVTVKSKEKSSDTSQLSQQSKKISQEILALKKEIEIVRQQRKAQLAQKDSLITVKEEIATINKVVPEKEKNSVDHDLNNLQLIKGIGPKTAKVLGKIGIKNITDLSETTPEILEDILSNEKGRFSLAAPDTWILQAQLMISGNVEALKKFQQQLSA